MTIPCLDENTARALLEGRLPAASRVAIDQHLEGCDACRERLAERRPIGTSRLPGEPELATGTLVGPYRLGPAIGRGSAGTVDRASDVRTIGIVAPPPVSLSRAPSLPPLVPALTPIAPPPMVGQVPWNAPLAPASPHPRTFLPPKRSRMLLFLAIGATAMAAIAAGVLGVVLYTQRDTPSPQVKPPPPASPATATPATGTGKVLGG